MKVLITTMSVGDTAPGFVFEKLIKGLSEIHEVDVLTPKYCPSIKISRINKIIQYSYKETYPRISKLLICFFNIKPYDIIKANKAANLCDSNYDIIFSLVSFNNYTSFIAGGIVAKRLHIKHLVYSVDAIPAPIEWSSKCLNAGTKKFISKYLSRTDGLFSSNNQMLEYQLSIFKKKKSFLSGVIYTPSIDNTTLTHNINSSTYVFLYTGSIYGLRKVGFLFEAFKKILKKYPNCILEFVGTVISEKDLSKLTPIERTKIIINPFTNNLSEYYAKAIALIDIDADFKNDIYLSSKIANYITVNRIIISETGMNSPSRKIFKNIPSIIQCDHNVEEIYNALEVAITNSPNIDFNDRKDVIELFKLNNIILKVNNYLKCAIKN